jgi:hypothetical protein
MPNKNDNETKNMTEEEKYLYNLHKHRYWYAGIIYPILLAMFLFLYVIPINILRTSISKKTTFNKWVYETYLIMINSLSIDTCMDFIHALSAWIFLLLSILIIFLLFQWCLFKWRVEKIINIASWMGIFFILISLITHFLK